MSGNKSMIGASLSESPMKSEFNQSMGKKSFKKLEEQQENKKEQDDKSE